MRLPTLLSALVLTLAPAFAACDDDKATDTISDSLSPDTTGDTAGDTSVSDTISDTTTDVPTDACGVDTICGDTSPADTTDTSTPETAAEVEVSAPTRVEAACSEAGYAECFINDDCQAGERCENMSANDVEIPCCVAGARGTKVAGEACTSENECDTSLCISYNDGPRLCSKPCDGSGTDCPAAASACIFGFCVPE